MRREILPATGFLTAGIAALIRDCGTVRYAYAASVLPRVREALRAVFSATQIPVCEIGLIALPLVFAFFIMTKRRRAAAWLCVLLALSLTCTWLPVCYTAKSLEQPDAKALTQMCIRLSRSAANLREGLLEDERGRLKIPYDDEIICRLAAQTACADVAPKAARFSAIWKALGISGLYSPVTNEAAVDFSIADAALPFTLSHELMHAKGVSSEAEANYEAYLACGNGDPYFRYSGEINALWYAMNALRDADRAMWEAVVSEMDEAVLSDFRALNGFGEAKESALTRAQDILTDFYIALTGGEDYTEFVAYLAASPKPRAVS